VRFLVAKGVPQHIISAQGFGESRPVASNETPQGRAKRAAGRAWRGRCPHHGGESPVVRRYDALAPPRFHFDEGAMPGVRAVMGAELLDMPQPLADSRLRQQIDARCEALARRPPPTDR